MTNPLRPLLPAFAAAVMLAFGAWAAGPSTVAVEPPQVFNSPDVAAAAPGLQAALAGRLSAPAYRVITPSAGGESDADWRVRTTITRLGTKMSIDAFLEPRDPTQGSRRVFQTADSVDGLLGAIETLAASLREELAGAASTPPAPTAAAAAVAPPVPTPSPSLPPAAPLPPPVVSAPSVPPAPVAPASPLAPLQAGANSDLAQAFLRYRTGAAVPGQAKGMAVADLDRDGAVEILVLVEDRLHAFRDEGGEMKAVWSFAVKAVPNPCLLSVGDGDGDGTPDVFVAGLSDDKAPVTRVYQWSGTGLAEHGPAVQALIRAIPGTPKGVEVAGLVAGIGKNLFAPKAFLFSWQEGAYRKDGPLPLPVGLTPINLDWCPCGPSGQSLAAATTDADAFRVYDSSFRELYQSDETLNGSATTLFGDQRSQTGGDADFLRIGTRTVFYSAPDGTVQWLLHKNHGFMAHLFERSASFTHGQWLAFRWDGLTLVPTAMGPKIPGYFADLDLGPTPGQTGRKTLYTALVQSQGIWNVERTTRLLAVDL